MCRMHLVKSMDGKFLRVQMLNLNICVFKLLKKI